MGRSGASFVGYGPMWAQVSMTPFSQYKGWLAEGGIRNALILSGPWSSARRELNHGVKHVADLMPTLLEGRRRQLSKTNQGRELPPADRAKSWMPMLSGKTDSIPADKDLSRVGSFRNRAVAAGRLEAALAVTALRQG